MDRRSWLWRRKSSEKSPGETDSIGSVSSHSERFSDDQRSQSPELISKAVTIEEEATADIKILTERLSATLLNLSLKEDLAKQHAKVAEEAVSGWEKAENEAEILKQQLDASTSKISALEDRNSHLDSALKECVRQLWQGREEKNQKFAEWETKKTQLEAQINELQARLQTEKEEASSTVSVHEGCYLKLEALEKENSALKLELLSKAEEIEIRTIERDLSTKSAESASKQQLEGIKKLTKLEAECRKLRVMIRKSGLDNQSEYSGGISVNDNEVQSPSQKLIRKNSMATLVEISLMDDFLEMEKLAALSHSESGRKHELDAQPSRVSELEEKVEMVEVEKLQMEMAMAALQNRITELKKVESENEDLNLLLSESRKQIHDLQRQLNKAEVNLSELETTKAEKLEVTICLNGTKKQLEISQNRLKETERKLTELQTLLRLTKTAKEAAENGLKSANAKTVAAEDGLKAANAKTVAAEDGLKAANAKIEAAENGLKSANAKKEAAENGLKAANAKTEAAESGLKSANAKIEAAENGLKAANAKIKGAENGLKAANAKTMSAEDGLKAANAKIEAAENGLKAANAKKEAVESRLREVEEEAESLILKIQSLEDQISKLKHELKNHKETKSDLNYMNSFDEDFKVKQEKELAMAASKFAECQRTIASLGQRLQSLATFEDFLIES